MMPDFSLVASVGVGFYHHPPTYCAFRSAVTIWWARGEFLGQNQGVSECRLLPSEVLTTLRVLSFPEMEMIALDVTGFQLPQI